MNFHKNQKNTCDFPKKDVKYIIDYYCKREEGFEWTINMMPGMVLKQAHGFKK